MKPLDYDLVSKIRRAREDLAEALEELEATKTALARMTKEKEILEALITVMRKGFDAE